MSALAFYRGKKVFITGHTGFKGSWLCKVLLHAGAELTGYGLPPSAPSLFEQIKAAADIDSINGDVRNREALIAAMRKAKPDAVIHLAAQPLVRLSYREPALTYETNVMGTVNVLEAVRQTEAVRSVVNITTDKVYENKEWPWAYRENENLMGRDPYSNSKSCSELVTHSYRTSFFDADGAPAISTARSGNVIGGGDYAEDRIIPDCVRAASGSAETADKQIVVRNPHSIRPYQHVLDTLAGYLLLTEKQAEDAALAGAYNFGPDDSSCVTTGMLAQLFCDAWGGGVSIRTQNDGGPHEANFLKLDCSKAHTVLGWRPQWDIKTALAQTIAFAQCKTDAQRLACMEEQIKNYFRI